MSFLIETRGVGIGRDSYARRVHTHVVAMTRLLNTAAENAERLMKTVEDVRADIVRHGREPAAGDTWSHEVTDRRASATYVEGRVTSRVTTEVATRSRTLPAGSYVYLMGQPNANVIAVALEPESPSSFVSFGYIPSTGRGRRPRSRPRAKCRCTA